LCVGPAPKDQLLGVVLPGSPPVDFLPYGDGKYTPVFDMVGFANYATYNFGSESSTPDPAGSLWARVLHLQEFARCWYAVTLSNVVAGNEFWHGSEVGGYSEPLQAVAADAGPGEFLVGATDAETAQNLVDAINLEGVTATADGNIITIAGPVGDFWYVLECSETFAIDPYVPKGFGWISRELSAFDDRITALENQGE
jgi:hypothetical protein